MEKKGRTQLFVQENNTMTFVQEFEKMPAYFDLEELLRKRPGSIARPVRANTSRNRLQPRVSEGSRQQEVIWRTTPSAGARGQRLHRASASADVTVRTSTTA
jgi:hypothetical protein